MEQRLGPVVRRVVIAGLIAVLVGGAAGRAQATTGPTQYLPHSRYKVGKSVQALYIGQYTLQTAAPGARITGGAMGMEVNGDGYLYGVAQFYGYDAKGFQSTWTSTLYNFHQTKQQTMIFDLLASNARLLLGRVFIDSRARSGDLSGHIQLPGGRFSIKWHKISTP